MDLARVQPAGNDRLPALLRVRDNVGGVQQLVRRLLQKEEVPVIIQADTVVQSGLLMRVIDEAKLGGAADIRAVRGMGYRIDAHEK